MLNKKKIINDPVHGFITVNSELVFDIIQHPLFQRLRRIRQLGLTDLVYPGALHTRFHHALGAMHLMSTAIATLQSKGTPISEEEKEASLIAILLHDAGHSPFSHALEPAILYKTHHEQVSVFILQQLNKAFNGKLELALQIFQNTYHRRFFYQLVSSQLDVDRLDYLMRDSFYTGVHEGQIGAERIIKMLCVVDDQVVIEEKGIYSIESFLVSRRLMYWQVYLHKTVIAAEQMLFKIIQRAKVLARTKNTIEASQSLLFFLKNDAGINELNEQEQVFAFFAALDDYDIWSAIKNWTNHPDAILSLLCSRLLSRKLFKISLQKAPFDPVLVEQLVQRAMAYYSISADEASYIVLNGSISNHAYLSETAIKVCSKQRQLTDVASASDLPNISALTKPVSKFYICYPKELQE